MKNKKLTRSELYLLRSIKIMFWLFLVALVCNIVISTVKGSLSISLFTFSSIVMLGVILATGYGYLGDFTPIIPCAINRGLQFLWLLFITKDRSNMLGFWALVGIDVIFVVYLLYFRSKRHYRSEVEK